MRMGIRRNNASAQGGSSNSNNKTTSRNGGNNGRKGYKNFRITEFKFQLHDPSRKGTYTFEKIFEAIVLKI